MVQHLSFYMYTEYKQTPIGNNKNTVKVNNIQINPLLFHNFFAKIEHVNRLSLLERDSQPGIILYIFKEGSLWRG